ncbi:MAG TPA: hypothetical protein VN033_03985 [Vulgatibacter sp.]|nr:hypothetical protein [Vulgatibacter sp.]
MSQLAKIVLTAVAVIVVAFIAIDKYDSMQEHYEYRLAKEQVRSEFLERSAAVRALADSDRYDEESRGLFKWYFAELTKVYNRFPKQKGAEEAYLRDLEERKAKGQVKPSDYEGLKASYDQIREIWDLLRDGKYAPALTAGDSSLRLDFLEFEPGTVDGRKGIQGRFVLWGAMRRRVEERAGNQTQTRVDVQASFPDVQLRMFGANGKPVAEMSFGMPSGAYVPYPEARLEDFPPMAYLGSFAFPLVPYEAHTVEIEAAASSRSPAGNEIMGRFKWTMPVPAEWKLGEGQAWEGATIEEREELAEPAGRRR